MSDRRVAIKGSYSSPGHGNDDMPAFRHPIISFILVAGEERRNLVGMVDTGSDLCRIDADVAAEFNLPAGEPMPSILAGVNRQVPTVAAEFLFPDGFVLRGGRFPTGPFRRAGCQYDALLGMDFIQHYELVMSVKAGVFDLSRVVAADQVV